jgi:hypothetical protein
LCRTYAAAGPTGLGVATNGSTALGAVVVEVDEDGGGLHLECLFISKGWLRCMNV